MYRTLLVCNDEREDVVDLALLSRTVAGSYGKVIDYADRAATVDGVTSLVNPTEGVFDSITSLEILRGKYIYLNDTVYFIPSDVDFYQASVGNGTVITSYIIRASHAQKVHVVGFRVWSGASEANAIQTIKITGSSNNGDDLVLGSVCSSVLEAKIYSKNSDIYISAGSVLLAYKVSDTGEETLIGTYNVETAEWPSKRTYKVVAYDNVRKLDADITPWLRSLTGWPYAITDFYSMLCEHFGLEWHWASWDGVSDFLVYQFDVEDGTTGRQLMGIICEVMGNYCIALPNGALTANWYRTEATRIYYSKKLMPGSDPLKETFRYQGAMSHGDFDVEDIRFVRVREEDKEDSPLWPDYGTDADVSNAYVITGNPILLSHPTYKTDSTDADSVRTALTKIAERFDYTRYRPFKATVPEAPGMVPGKYVYVGDADNNIMFISPITHMVWNGHRMTLECTAKQNRRNSGSPNNWTGVKMKQYVDKTSGGGGGLIVVTTEGDAIVMNTSTGVKTDGDAIVLGGA